MKSRRDSTDEKIQNRLFVFAIIVFCPLLLTGCKNKYDYERPKQDALNYLTENEAELVVLFEDMLAKEPAFPEYRGEYKGNAYFYNKTDTSEYVQLDLDAQGMLGGQYRGIICCPQTI